MSLQLQPPCPLDMSSSSNIATNWKKFKEAFANYEIAIGIDEGNDKRRVAIFLHVIGDAGVEKYNTMTWAEPSDKFKIRKVIENFDKECSPKSNVIMERYKFLKRKQESTETCDQFVTQLRVLVKTCDYGNSEEMVRDQFILNLYDDKAREKLLDHVQMGTTPMSLEKAVNFVKNYEMRVQQKKDMGTQEVEVNAIRKSVSKSMNRYNKNAKTYTANDIKDCRYCGRDHKVRQCPAFGQSCSKCGKKNHFARLCMQSSGYREKPRFRSNSEKVRNVDFEDNSSSGSEAEYQEISALTENIGSVTNSNERKQIIKMIVNGKQVFWAGLRRPDES